MSLTDRIKGIKAISSDKANEFNDRNTAMIRSRYIGKVMEDEGWTYEETIRKCCGTDDERVPKYSVGWQLCDMALQVLIKKEDGRRIFMERYLTTDEERRVFVEEFLPAGAGSMSKVIKNKITHGKN